MSTKTTTIRVSVPTRDRLADQARARGISVSALVADLVTRAEREAIFRAERAAEHNERAAAGVREEMQDWDSAAGDGLG